MDVYFYWHYCRPTIVAVCENYSATNSGISDVLKRWAFLIPWIFTRVKQYWGYLLHTLFIWVSYLVMFALPFYAVDGASSVPFSGMLLAAFVLER